MTTPRDAIGLSERLRRQGAGEDGYRTVFNGTLLEAATALDALQARVKELEAKAAALFWSIPDDIAAQIKCGDLQKRAAELLDAESRATSAEQERDKALERAAKMAEQHAWSHPSAGLLGPEMNSMEIAAAIRRLAAGAEKEGK